MGKIYQTHSTSLSAWLIINGFDDYKVDRSLPKVQFIFHYTDNRFDDLVFQWDSGLAGITQQFYKTYRNLLRIVKSGTDD
jgi:hypothetical protein